MKNEEHVYNIPLEACEDKVVFEIVVDRKIYDIAKKSKDPIDIIISIQTNTNDLEFDIRSNQN